MARDEDDDARIAAGIRLTVAREYKANPEAITLKYIRTLAEKELGLESDFLKTDPHWKQESKTLIQQEVQILENNARVPSPPLKKRARTEVSPKAKKTSPPGKPTDEDAEDDDDEPKPAKRARKPKTTLSRQKDSPISSPKMHGALPTADDDAVVSDVELDDSPKKRKRTAPKKKAASPASKRSAPAGDKADDSPLSDLESDDAPKPTKRAPKKSKPAAISPAKPGSSIPPLAPADGDSGDDSPLSELEATPPPARKRGTSKTKSKSKTPASPSSKPAAKRSRTTSAKASSSTADLPPSEAKIKALQGQLVKCGVRRIWSRELAQYDTAAAKIKHLQDMLKEIGLKGQFSLAKAKKIKEERELMAEVEAIQEGAEEFTGRGARRNAAANRKKPAVMDSEDDDEDDQGNEEDGGKPKRKLARGMAELDFLGDQSSDSD